MIKKVNRNEVRQARHTRVRKTVSLLAGPH